MTARRALIVANDDYADPGLARLRSPAADAVALAEVLGAADIGGFEVAVSRNEPNHLVQAAIEDFFAEAAADDLLVLWFSGHGVKAETGELYLAAQNTRPSRLASSAVPADFVQRCMKSTRSRSVVLFLDCCYGGAFPQGAVVRASGPVDVLASFPGEGARAGGRGRAVITASSAMEYAFEGTGLTQAPAQPSVFAGAVVRGLRTGDADRDEDGLVSLDELYDYVYDQVRLVNPAQTPSRQFDLQGELHIARSGRRRIRPAPLPADVEAALREGSMFARIGVLGELSRRLAGEDLPSATAALQALREVAAHDILQVASLATHELAAQALTLTPSALVVDPAPDGATTHHRVDLAGSPLARAAVVRSDVEQVRGALTGDHLDVEIRWPLPSGAVSIVVESPFGPVSVPISVLEPAVEAPEAVPAPEPAAAAPEPAAAAPAPAAAAPEPGPPVAPEQVGVPALDGVPPAVVRRRYDRPIASAVLFGVISSWFGLLELTGGSSGPGSALMVLSVAAMAAAAVDWSVLRRFGVLAFTVLVDSAFVVLATAAPLDTQTATAAVLLGVVVNAALLVAAVRTRARPVTVADAALVLLILSEVVSFLLTETSLIGALRDDYSMTAGLRTADGLVNLVSAGAVLWYLAGLSLRQEAARSG